MARGLNPERLGSTAALTALAGWVIVMYRGASIFELPFTAVWIGLVVCVALGFAVAGQETRRRAGALLVASVAALIGIFLVLIGPLAVAERQAAFAVLALSLAVAVGWIIAARGAGVDRVTLLLVGGALALWILIDRSILSGGLGLYDFRVYLGAGADFRSGEIPYLTHALTELPASADADTFLYPPPLLPFFAALSALPFPVVAVGWVALLSATGWFALRLFGLPSWWALVFLAFPPLLKGIDSGNVANVLLMLLAVGPAVGAALTLGVLTKIQASVATLWLVRERRWRDLGLGVALVAGIVLLTLPLVGIAAWGSWAASLGYRAESQENLPILYGLSLALVLPPLLFVLGAVLAVLLGLWSPGRRGLAALGLATIVASPSLWPHGFLVALPALLLLDRRLLWLGLGIGVQGIGLWLLPILGVWGLVRSASTPRGEGAIHPVGRDGEWWPARLGRRTASLTTKAALPSPAVTRAL